MKTTHLHKNANESFQIELENRGACGLQMNHRLDNEEVASIERLENISSSNLSPGDSIKAVFKITALRPGTVTITFFETQPWNEEFEEIIAENITLHVE